MRRWRKVVTMPDVGSVEKLSSPSAKAWRREPSHRGPRGEIDPLYAVRIGATDGIGQRAGDGGLPYAAWPDDAD